MKLDYEDNIEISLIYSSRFANIKLLKIIKLEQKKCSGKIVAKKKILHGSRVKPILKKPLFC